MGSLLVDIDQLGVVTERLERLKAHYRTSQLLASMKSKFQWQLSGKILMDSRSRLRSAKEGLPFQTFRAILRDEFKHRDLIINITNS